MNFLDMLLSLLQIIFPKIRFDCSLGKKLSDTFFLFPYCACHLCKSEHSVEREKKRQLCNLLIDHSMEERKNGHSYNDASLRFLLFFLLMRI